MFEPDNASFFEASAGAEIDLRKQMSGVEAELTKQWTIAPMRVAWADAAKKIPAKIYFEETMIVEERSIYEASSQHLITCDARGRPKEIVTRETSNDGHLEYRWLTFAADANGRIEQMDLRRASYYREFEEEPGTNSFGTLTAKARVELAKK
jgi:hypothetical protein